MHFTAPLYQNLKECVFFIHSDIRHERDYATICAMKRYLLIMAPVAVSAVVSTAALPLVPAPRKCTEEGGRLVKSGQVGRDDARFVADASLPAEGYRLKVSSGGIVVHHRDKAGALYALKSLEQIAVFTNGVSSVPCVEIEDYPSFRWRGVHIDESRHFFGKETLKQVLDLMAMHKLNVLHWHLTDDQGWRLEVPGRPELIKYGAVRPQSPVHGVRQRRTASGEPYIPLNGQVYGPFYYTPADVREIVAYAAERCITIVPEIEFPGHFAAALAAYPAFACRPENFADRSPRCIWGVEKDVLCAGNDEALKFLEDVLDYVAKVFPGEFVHIGGDECPVVRWRDCKKCQARIKAENLGGVDALQPWITRRMEKFLRERGKRTVGWDEYLAGDVPEDAVCMSWHSRNDRPVGFVSAKEAVRRGHEVVMTPVDWTYFYCGQEIPDDPFLYGRGDVGLKKVYDFNPVADIPEEFRPRILGGQCCNWSEYTWNEYDLGWKMWPRTCAIAEALWTGDGRPGYDSFLKRMRVHRKRLVGLGVFCAPLPPYR